MRVLIAELKQETSTFNPAKTWYDHFQVHFGDDVPATFRATDTELAGAMAVFEADGRIELVPTMAAASISGGPIHGPDLDRLLSELTTSIRENKDVDGAYLCLHGAMAGEDEPDPEGRLLREVREILGEIPIVVSLDLHAVITDALVEAADILVPFHTYPHVDQYETGQRAARNLIRLLDRTVTPTTARVEIPMLVRGDELLTATGRFGEAIRMCRAVEADPRGLAAGVIIGNAFTDVPALQSNVLVTTDNDPDAARSEAERIARFMWKNRERFQAELVSLDESIRLARETEGLTVFSDAADATASGASGDSNAILEGLLALSSSEKPASSEKPVFEKRALLPMVDAPAVRTAFAAGVGKTVEVTLGGTLDPARFRPLGVTGYVKSLHDGHFDYENGTAARAGRVAVLSVNHVDVLVTERAVYVVGRRVYQAHGLEPADYDLVVVKSPNGFRTHYESIASRIVPVDVPGSTSAFTAPPPLPRSAWPATRRGTRSSTRNTTDRCGCARRWCRRRTSAPSWATG